jgi:hypothetical protein
MSGDEQIRIYKSNEIVVPPGFNSIFEYGQQIIIATSEAAAEATKRSQELKQKHTKTIKRPVNQLIPAMLLDMFAEGWRPPEQG